MSLPIESEFAFTVGIVGQSGSGKSSIARSLKEKLMGLGMHVTEDNVGDIFRRESIKVGKTLTDYLAETPQDVLDDVADSQTLEYLRGSLGIAGWVEKYGYQTPEVLILSGRMISFLADMAKHSGDLPQDGYLGVVVSCPDNVCARRIVKKKGFKPTRRNIKEQMEILRERDDKDLVRYQTSYGIRSWKDLHLRSINDVFVDSSQMSVVDEVSLIMGTLVAKGMLPLLWDEHLRDLVGNSTHI